MKTVGTKEYVSVLRDLVEQGQEVQLRISGNSMAPFLVHQRDCIYFSRPSRALRVGDMVFYQRSNGQFVMHRICRIRKDAYYMVGDAQTVVEGPLRREQIFGLITKAQRKERWIGPGNLCWEFFAHVWVRMIPIRPAAVRVYGLCKRLAGLCRRRNPSF